MTADNYIIFNNLIIGQTANDHSAEVNRRGPENRITVHADKINNVVCLYALFHTREGKQTAEREAAEC